MMNLDRSESPLLEDDQEIEEEGMINSGAGAPIATPSQQRIDPNLPRNRSPSPPRALFRSTTGKGVAFTEEDVTFLRRFMEYRKYVKIVSPLLFCQMKGCQIIVGL